MKKLLIILLCALCLLPSCACSEDLQQSADVLIQSLELEGLQSSMREALGLKTVLSGNEKKGKITLSYHSAEELEHLYEVIGRLLG